MLCNELVFNQNMVAFFHQSAQQSDTVQGIARLHSPKKTKYTRIIFQLCGFEMKFNVSTDPAQKIDQNISAQADSSIIASVICL